MLILAFECYFSLMHYVKFLESTSKIIWFGFTRILFLVPGFTKSTKHRGWTFSWTPAPLFRSLDIPCISDQSRSSGSRFLLSSGLEELFRSLLLPVSLDSIFPIHLLIISTAFFKSILSRSIQSRINPVDFLEQVN